MFANTDRCPNCGIAMASDQRYCVECGERRTGGGLRDALPRTQAVATAPAAARRSRMRLSPNTSFIAGVGTLLLALGVGVLIGRTGDHTSTARTSAPVQVVTVPNAGATATTADAAAVSPTTAKKSSRKTHAKATHSHKAVATDLQKTATRSGVKLPPPVVKVGQKCAKGAKGCQGGKFTGNFFGGG
jgi:type IV secretory pathway TrbL component